MHHERWVLTPLIQACFIWLSGLVWARTFTPSSPFTLFLLSCAIAAYFVWRNDPPGRKWTVMAIVFALAAGRMALARPVIDPTYIAYYNDGPDTVTLVGLVRTEPIFRDTHTQLQLQLESLQIQDKMYRVQGTVLINAPAYPTYHYGDRLQVTGKLETPPVFADFSYKDYLAHQQIYSLMRRPHLQRLATQQGNPFWAALFAFKRHTSETINHILPEPHASLLNGILLGLENTIPKTLYDDFRRTGTSHIIVISGSNIAIVALILSELGQRLLKQRQNHAFILWGLLSYTLFVGADPSVSRAALMEGVKVGGRWVGRKPLTLNSLAFAQIVLTLINPLNLENIGFQLSFMATLGLILLVAPLQRGVTWLVQAIVTPQFTQTILQGVNEFLVITLAAQLATMPLLLYHFDQLSLVALFTNLLIAPAQPFIMTLGGIATLGGVIWLPLGQVLGVLAWLPLTWTVVMVEWTAHWPYAAISLQRLPLSLVLLWYAVMAAVVWWSQQPSLNLPAFRRQSVQPSYPLLGFGVGIGLLAVIYFTQPDGYLHVAFLDVGQGDAILITLPDGRQLLIDGGPSPTTLAWRLGQELPFWDRSLDVVINTHPDADHLGGLVELLKRYDIEQIMVSDRGGSSQLYQAWQQHLSVQPLVAQAGMAFVFAPNLTATILSPGAPSAAETASNNHSVVLHLQLGQISFLFTGDIEATVEQRLLQDSALLAATVLKSPHHGSKTSSSDAFLRAVRPQVVVISVGADNPFGHPHAEVLARYAAHEITVLRTDEQGTIELVTDGQSLWQD